MFKEFLKESYFFWINYIFIFFVSLKYKVINIAQEKIGKIQKIKEEVLKAKIFSSFLSKCLRFRIVLEYKKTFAINAITNTTEKVIKIGNQNSWDASNIKVINPAQTTVNNPTKNIDKIIPIVDNVNNVELVFFIKY
ncbi:MAG: hypothetical protein ACRC1F_02325 [Metamycoplasmataceae bacterium]